MSLALIRELLGHQSWADRQLLMAVTVHANACSDEKLGKTLHHIVLVQRIFTAMLTGAPFDVQKESQPVDSLAALEQLYGCSQASQRAFADGLTEEGLDRFVENPWIPNLNGTVAQVLLQVLLHSQNHRGQCLTRLRELTGSAPTLDYIIWLKLGRPV